MNLFLVFCRRQEIKKLNLLILYYRNLYKNLNLYLNFINYLNET